jgi:hypothetical protein
VLRANLKWNLVSRSIGWCLALTLAIGITSCDAPPEQLNRGSRSISAPPTTANADNLVLTGSQDGPLSEVNTPASIAALTPSLAKLQPKVQIVSPTADEVLTDDRVTVKFKVADLPLFKHPELGLGNHLHVLLDDKTVRGVADLDRPLVFDNLAAGTHTLRVFAARPWHESFKNDGAFDLVTFHVLTKTATNNPDPQQPLLTYSRPAGTYGAEPILLDYYLANVPAQADKMGSMERIPNWRIRATVNNQQFILDRWAPVYLQGFKQGKNWVRLELIDDRGNPIPNVYNDNVRIFTYEPQTKDALAQLIRGELSPEVARTLVDPNSYVASKPISLPTAPQTPSPDRTPAPAAATDPAKTPIPIAPNPIASAPLSPVAVPSPEPPIDRKPIAIVPSPTPAIVPPPIIALPSPAPTIAPPPVAIAKPTPSPVPTLVVTPSPVPVATPQPIGIVPLPAPTSVEPNHAPAGTNSTPAPQIASPPAKPAAPAIGMPIVPPSAVTGTKAPSVQPQPPATTNSPNSDPVKVPIDKPELSPSVAPLVTPPTNPPAPQVADKPATTPGDRVEPSQPQITAPSLPKPDRTASLPPVKTPAAPKPQTSSPSQVQNPAESTWQQQSIELFDAAKVQIRAFTNTIPAKSQRFAKNVRIWASYARDYATERIQAWREQH